MDINLHLPEIKFSDRPTKTQIVNTLNSVTSFLNKVSGSLLATEDYSVTDQSLAQLLNAVVQLKVASDLFDGKSTAGAARPGPQQVPQR